MENANKVEKYKGTFWRSDRPENKTEGILEFAYEENFRPILRTDKPLIELYEESKKDGITKLTFKSKVFSSDDNITIFGTIDNSSNGNKVSLYKCVPDNEGITSLEWFIGDDFVKSREHLNMENFSVDYNLLSDWIGGFGYKLITNNGPEDQWRFSLQFYEKKPIKNQVFVNGEYYNIEFVFNPIIEQGSTSNSVSIKELVSIAISKDIDKINFEEALKLAEYLRAFLSFATMEEIKIDNFIGYSKHKPENLPNDYLAYSKIRYFSFLTNPKPLNKKTLKQFMLFSYEDLLNNSSFSNAFQKWAQLYENLELGFINTFFTHSTDPMYYFWSLTPRIESYFRNKETKLKNENDIRYIMDKKIYNNEVRPKLLDIICSFYKNEEWLKVKEIWTSRINFLNETTLENFLEELINENKEIILKNNIMKEEDFLPFIKQCKDTRNYFAHLHKEKKKRIPTGMELVYLTNRLKIIFVILILKELGFEGPNIIEAINRARRKIILPY